jgi:hypothetical protein
MTNRSIYQLESSSEAASPARVIMEERLQKALKTAERVVETVESTVIDDNLVKGKAIDWYVQTNYAPSTERDVLDAEVIGEESSIDLLPNGHELRMKFGDRDFSVHPNALGQFADKGGMPWRYVSTLLSRGEWGHNLLVENLQTLAAKELTERRLLVRAVGGESRGILSDQFKRLDSKPILNALIGEFQSVGAVPVDGTATDTLTSLKAVLPMVFEPVTGECLLYGVDWRNSDFGCGRNSLKIYFERLWCLNGATWQSVLNQVHLGKKLEDNIEYSNVTLQLDTMANISKMKDVVRYAFAPETIQKVLDGIRFANERQLSPKDAVAQLDKLSKDEKAQTIELYNSPDVVNMPAGNTAYRLSNAVSWFANSSKVTAGRKLELQQVAGDLLGKVSIQASSV